MSLRDYARKRRFDDSPEPRPPLAKAPRRGRAEPPAAERAPLFVVQLHEARTRHYDFRLEVDGVLKSWAVPKGPSLRPRDKRLAVEVEDHPLDYASFEGDIPEGHYGAGHVQVFDTGTWSTTGDPAEALRQGKLGFTLAGQRLRGAFELVRTRRAGKQPQWLLFKRSDRYAEDREADDLLDAQPAAKPRAPARKERATQRASDADPGAGARLRRARDASADPRAPRREARGAESAASGESAREVDWRERALALPGARRGAVPLDFPLQLTRREERPPRGEAWLHEAKWDGYRMAGALEGGRITLRSRGGLDWSERFPEIVEALLALPIADARLDGELIAVDEVGHSSFAELQRLLSEEATERLRYVLFDLPALEGVDLREVPLLRRKQLLGELLASRPSHHLIYSSHVVGHGPETFEASREAGLEGIVSKRVDSRYDGGRSGAWLKSKHHETDDFVVVGYTLGAGARSGLGALLLARRADGALSYVGKVGTGFDDAKLRELIARLRPLERTSPTVELPPHARIVRARVRWVEPVLMVEVSSRGWGKEGLLRQAAFERLRDDKDAAEETESASKPSAPRRFPGQSAERGPAGRSPAGRSPAGRASTGRSPTGHERLETTASSQELPQPRLTHPEKLLFPDDGITKAQVFDYYRRVARWMLPELEKRPLSLVRTPGGVGAPAFFQKHHDAGLGEHVRAIRVRQKSGEADYLYVDSEAGLLELVQMNTLEFHPWGSRVEELERPDRLVLDLDPADDVDFTVVKESALELRERLRRLGLESFSRTSGGKGLHLVIPLAGGTSWDELRDFAEAFALVLAEREPQRYVATMSKARRKGRIFVDWLRNGRGSTSVASWSLRARAGAPVAMPLGWDELERLSGPQAFRLESAQRRAAELSTDPWAEAWELEQELPRRPR